MRLACLAAAAIFAWAPAAAAQEPERESLAPDGAHEVVFSDEEAVYVWGVDDTPGLDPWDRLVPYLVDTEHKSWTVHEYPLVADVDGDGNITYEEFIRGLRDPLSERRRAMVDKAFDLINRNNDEMISVADIDAIYDVSQN